MGLEEGVEVLLDGSRGEVRAGFGEDEDSCSPVRDETDSMPRARGGRVYFREGGSLVASAFDFVLLVGGEAGEELGFIDAEENAVDRVEGQALVVDVDEFD